MIQIVSANHVMGISCYYTHNFLHAAYLKILSKKSENHLNYALDQRLLTTFMFITRLQD